MLALVQVIIASEWLLVVLFRDKRPCEFSQAEFAMLQVYVMVLMVGALVLALRFFCHVYITYSYSHTGQTHRRAKLQAALLILTMLLSVCVWVTWIALLTYRNLVMGRRPDWDDPVNSIALVTNGWVLLLGHGVTQVRFMCQHEAYAKEPPMDLTGWTRSPEDPEADPQPGRDNGGFQRDTAGRGGENFVFIRAKFDVIIQLTLLTVVQKQEVTQLFKPKFCNNFTQTGQKRSRLLTASCSLILQQTQQQKNISQNIFLLQIKPWNHLESPSK